MALAHLVLSFKPSMKQKSVTRYIHIAPSTTFSLQDNILIIHSARYKSPFRIVGPFKIGICIDKVQSQLYTIDQFKEIFKWFVTE